MKIIGKNIYLRKLTESDATQKYCDWLNDPIVNKYLETRKSSIGELKKYIKEKNENDSEFFGIFDIENNNHIGNIKLEPIDFQKKYAILGILIGDKKYWNKGIGTEATRQLLKYAFNELNLDYIELGVISEHLSAINLYEKIGFKKINLEKNAINHNGKLYDKLTMRINKSEFINSIIILQARMSSTRLPKKALMEIEGKSILWHLVQRMKKSKNSNDLIIATSLDESDDLIEKFCIENNVKCFRGNLNDVLDRFYQCSKKYNADVIVRVTGDSPLNDPKLVDDFIKELKDGNYDYVSNGEKPWMDGFDVEVFTFKALEKTWKEAVMESEREHVTPYIKKSNLFKIKYIKNDERFANIQFSIDRIEDLNFVSEIYKKLFEKKLDHNFTYMDVIKIIEEELDLLNLNKNSVINEGYQKSLKEDKKVK
jgi:spore coat polysaccharide biosynthesis protein SpsF